MRISVNSGHSTKVSGAVGIIWEHIEAELVALRLVEELKARGHDARLAPNSGRTVSEYLREEYGHANNMNAEMAISIHFNAFNGRATGTEVLYQRSDALGLSASISQSLAAALGINNRGAKLRTDLGFLKNTKMRAVIVEVCFVDNPADVAAYRKLTPTGVAKAIADGVVGAASSTPSKPAVAAPSKPATKSVSQMADEVVAGKHGNGNDARRRSLGVSASVYAQVRAEVNRRLTGKTTSSGKKTKSVEQMADEVIAGKHGTGHDKRRKSLGVSASVYEQVRAEVNVRLIGKKSASSKTAGKTLDQMAHEVILGKHGNGHDNRRKSLGVSASVYKRVRNRVNQLLK